MKKLIILLLAAAMCFSLVACGGGETPNTDDNSSAPKGDNGIQFDISDEMSAEEKFAVISNACNAFVQVKINPEFELYLVWDESIHEMRVVGARSINEDAETLFQNISVSNMTLYDALYLIFNTAIENGYLNSESNIEIAYYGQVEGYNVTEVIPVIVDSYQQENNISFSYNTSFTQIGDSNLILNPEDDYDEVEYDADGKAIKTVRHVDDNSIETCTYDSDGNITLRVTEYQNDETTVAEYFDQGAVVKIAVNTPWETRTEIYDADGKKISAITDNTESGFYVEDYYTDGILVESYYRDAERECTETFDADGNKISQIIDNKAEGYYSENYWNNGNRISEVIDNKTEGYYSETYWTYYEDGTVESRQVNFSCEKYGYYEEMQYYQSGAVSMDYRVYAYGPSGDNRFYYDESGNPTYFEGKNNFGEWVEIVYNADGSRVERTYESSGKVRIETRSADGIVTVTYE